MKILIVRFSSIGDIVLTSPVIRCAREQLEAELHFITKKKYASLLVANPHLSKVWTFDKEITEVLPELRAVQFDYIIDLHNNLRSLRLKLSLRKKAFSFNKINIAKWLMVRWKINRLPDTHIVSRYLDTLASLGVTNDDKGLDYFIPEDTPLPPDMPQGDFMVFAIGAAHATKRLPLAKMKSITSKINLPIVLLGGTSEVEAGEALASSQSHIYNMCGKASLHQSALLIDKSVLVLTHDTGMMHIAAALKKPIISVWGNTIPAFGMYPYYPSGFDRHLAVEVKGLACRPCSKIGHATCPKGHFRCMKDIDEAMVVNGVEVFLGNTQ